MYSFNNDLARLIRHLDITVQDYHGKVFPPTTPDYPHVIIQIKNRAGFLLIDVLRNPDIYNTIKFRPDTILRIIHAIMFNNSIRTVHRPLCAFPSQVDPYFAWIYQHRSNHGESFSTIEGNTSNFNPRRIMSTPHRHMLHRQEPTNPNSAHHTDFVGFHEVHHHTFNYAESFLVDSFADIMTQPLPSNEHQLITHRLSLPEDPRRLLSPNNNCIASSSSNPQDCPYSPLEEETPNITITRRYEIRLHSGTRLQTSTRRIDSRFIVPYLEDMNPQESAHYVD